MPALPRRWVVRFRWSATIGMQSLVRIPHRKNPTLRPTTRRLQARKTGAIIAFSLEAGAILGGASQAQKQALAVYSDNLGLTFQITDDLLDVESDAATLGKPTGQDAEAGKVTFISHYGIEGARAEAKRLTDEAKSALADERLFDATKTAYLLHMADYVLHRSH